MNRWKRVVNPSRSPDYSWALASALYFVLVVVSHDWVSQIYSRIVEDFGRSMTESSLHKGSLVLVSLTAGVCLFIFKRRKNVNIRILFLWISLGFGIVAAERFLVVTNIERIHYPQYAILALLLRMALPDDFFVVFLATLAGMLDEFIQFIWNPQYTKYLDFNDFALNGLGALAGVTLFLTLSTKARPVVTRLRKIKMYAYIGTGSILTLIGLGVAMGRIVPYMAGEGDFSVLTRMGGKVVLVLSFLNKPDFWTVSEYGRRYHILSPLEGFVVLALLLVVYRCLLPKS